MKTLRSGAEITALRKRCEEREAEIKQLEEEAEKTKQENLCPICDKDVRFFCDCRAHDKDYERPLPEGWKNCKLGFTDTYDKYSTGDADQLKPRPPSPPRPYQGGRHKYPVGASAGSQLLLE